MLEDFITLSGLKEYSSVGSILSIRSILSLRSSLLSDLELDSFESSFQKILSLCTVSRQEQFLIKSGL